MGLVLLEPPENRNRNVPLAKRGAPPPSPNATPNLKNNVENGRKKIIIIIIIIHINFG